jgi:hypothetical protein
MTTLPISLETYQRQHKLFGQPLFKLTTPELIAATRDCLRVSARGVLDSVQAIRKMRPPKICILG